VRFFFTRIHPRPISALLSLRESRKLSLAPLARIGWTADTADLYEINEAFAVVAMARMRDLDLPHDKVNVDGGACALGHPIGASGARTLLMLLSALKARGLKCGAASLCIGGGEATALALERV